MSIKLILCDFDGTITKEDVLDKICELANKRAESQLINREYMDGKLDGGTALEKRFGLIKGISLSDIKNSVFMKAELTDGVKEFFSYTNKHNIPSLVISGNAQFVLQYFKDILGFTEYYGSEVNCRCGAVAAWSEGCKAVNKEQAAKQYIENNGLKYEEVLAVGDSSSDNSLYQLAAHRFIVNQKSNVDFGVKKIRSFKEIIAYIEETNENPSDSF